MSKVVDERVVEMRFDNQHFEKNVSTTMSTLDKLKQKLNLGGAAKGLDEVNSAAKRVDMKGLGVSVEAVSAKFSALQVIGVTALANITNSAVNAGKRMVNALTLEPITTGFKEYETQINAVQTILANTSSKGTTVDQVNKALDELNTYADKTIYNFTEMTRNIGTFTAAGVDLDTSVSAIKGIANLAAVSGSTSQQASTAMYQLSQALATGTVKLQDWNSVVNAGMGGEVFQNALKRTAKVMGTDVDALIKKYGSFRESLTRGEWLTTEILTKTLDQFTMAAEEGTEQWEKYKKSLMDEGYTEAQANEILKMANTATDAATKVKTFTQLWDVLKESAQSGWSQTWKLIIGDFEEAKSLLTPLADFLTGAINKFSETRNKLLESALGKSFTGLVDKVKGMTDPIKKSADGVKEVVNSVKDYANIVDEIIGGKWGTGAERWNALTKAGYDWAHAQNLVNEKLGDSTRHATEYAEAQDKVSESQKKNSKSSANLSKAQADVIANLIALSDAELKAKGYTDEQIKAFRELEETSKKLGIPIKDLLTNIDQINGRWLLINSFKNAGQGLVTVFKSVGQAWREAFHGNASDEDILAKRSEKLFNLIAALHRFSTKLVVSEETAGKLTRTFKGLFAIVDILTTVLGSGFKIAFKLISQVLSYFSMDILDVTAGIGDAIVKFRDWLESIFDISGILDIVVPAVKTFAEVISGLFIAFKNSDQFQKFVDFLNSIFDSLSKSVRKAGGIKKSLADFFSGIFEPFTKLSGIEGFIDGLKSLFHTLATIDFNADGAFTVIIESIHSAFSNLKDIDLRDVGTFIFDGLIVGLFNGAKKVIETVVTVAQNLIDKFCSLLGINSPSTVFMAIGGFIIAGLIAGIKEGLISVPEALQGIVDKCIDIFQAIDWGTIMAFGVSIAGLMFIKKIGDVLENFSAPFAGIGDILENVAGVVESFGKVTKAAAFNIRMKGIKQLAIAIAIIAGSIIALVQFGGDDYGKMWNAVGMIVVLAAVLAGLSIAMNKLSDTSVDIEKGKFSLSGLKSGLMSMAIAVALIAGVTYLLGRMDADAAEAGFIRLGLVMISMLAFVKICQEVTKGNISDNITKIGALMIKLSIAMGLMVGVCKLIDTLEPGEMVKAGIFALAFGVFVYAITAVAKSSGNNVSKVGGMMLKLAIAMALMVGVCKIIDTLEPKEVIKGAIFAGAFLGFVKALIKITTIGKKQQIAKLGGLLLSISVSMALMVGVCKLVGGLSVTEMLKGAAFAAGFAVFLWALVSITKIGNEQSIAKVSGTILAISVSIGILALVCMMLGLINIGNLAKGIIAVGALGLIMSVMIKSLRGANDVKGSLMAISIAIALMAVAVAGLSFIDTAKLYSAVGAISILMGMFSLLIKSTKDANGAIGPLIVMTTAIGLMAGMLWLLSSVTDSAKENIQNAAALSLLMLAMAGVMKIISKMETNLGSAIKTIIGLSALAAPMALFALTLSLMKNVDNATTNVVAISGLMIAMTGVLAAVSAIGKYLSQGIIPGILGLTAMVIPMLTFVGILSLMNKIENAASNATALTKLMTVITLLLVPLSIIGAIATSGVGAAFIIAGIVSLTAMAIPMLAFVGVMALMNKIENAISNANLLIGLMTIMTGLLTQLDIIGPFALVGVAALSGLTILIGAIAGLVVALGGLNELTDGGLEKLINSGIPLLIKLAEGIGMMVGKFVGCMGEAIADSLVKIGEDIVSLMKSLKTASEHADGIEASSFDGVKELLTVLGDIGLTMVGTSFADIFTIGGTSMEKFETDGKAFFKALKSISSEMVGFSLPEDFSAESVITLLDMMKEVSSRMMGTSWKEAFTLGDGTTMDKFKSDAIAFFGAIKEISTEMTGFNLPEDFSVESLTNLLDSLKAISNYGLRSSWKDTFTFDSSGEGTSTMEQFKNNAINFFKAIKAIVPEMTGFTFPEDFSIGDFTKLLETLKTVGTSMAGVTWSELFTLGEGTSMDELKTYGVGLFSAIKAISTEATGVTTESLSVGTTAIEKIKEIFASLKNIDYSGVEQFTGIGTGGFGADGPMHDIGAAIKDFGTQVSGLDTEAVNVAVTAASRIRTLIANLVDLDASGVENFKAKAIGTAIKDYSAAVAEMDPGVVSSSISSANRLRNFIASLVDLDSSGIANFRLSTIGNSIRTYANSVAGIDPAIVSSSISAANRLRNFISSLVGLDASGVSTFTTAISKLGQTSIDSFIKAFAGSNDKLTSIGGNMAESISKGFTANEDSIKTSVTNVIIESLKNVKSKNSSFKTAGSELITQLANGMTSKKSTATKAVSSIVSSAAEEADDGHGDFYNAGSYLAEGFADGISSGAYAAVTAAAAMANAAKKAAEEALGIASPSKEFYAIGRFAGMGLINALKDYGTKTYKAGAEVASQAKSGLGDAIGKISDLINSDIDTQPTIRPVLDLSDVQSGAGAINGLFGMTPSVGVMSNVRAINSMMSRNQNGGNAEIVSAIDKLRGDLSNLGGDTYQINGITYGADSEVSSAIQTLVRAMKVEGRT